MHSRKYLFYISQNYSFEILRPLQQEIIRNNDQVAWFVAGKEVNTSNFLESENVLNTVHDVVSYNPHACFVPGNVIPTFFPGIKVQVFHGLEWKKKGHFVIRDCFDLYCTHGQATTERFNELATKHQFFDVVETGWPKLDNLFNTPKISYFDNSNPVILYAPTFSPSLTSAPELFEQIKTLTRENNYNWLVKFHPKMDNFWVEKYKDLISNKLKVIETPNINELLQSADIMISDTSSVIGEFSLLDKPVVSLNNASPENYLINISQASELASAITAALSPTAELIENIERYAYQLHPYKDGGSSARILKAVEQIITNGKHAQKKLPLNLFRNLKQRKKLNYWRW